MDGNQSGTYPPPERCDECLTGLDSPHEHSGPLPRLRVQRSQQFEASQHIGLAVGRNDLESVHGNLLGLKQSLQRFSGPTRTRNDKTHIVKLIRSKGVGIYFVTQNPADIPNGVLGQLGLKVQHALRAFTAQDRKAIKLASENYPLSDYYKTDEVITQLGIGEALVTALSEKGVPSPLAATMLRAPQSRMDVLTDTEIASINQGSKLVKKYGQIIDRESAFEMLTKKISAIEQQSQDAARRAQMEKEAAKWDSRPSASRKQGVNPVVKVLTNPTFIRGVFGILSKALR